MHILALQQTKPSLPSVTSTFVLLLKRLSFFPRSSFTRDEQSMFAGSFFDDSITFFFDYLHCNDRTFLPFCLYPTKFISVELFSDGRHDL